MAEKDITLKELIQDIDYRLSHLEDIYADNRTIMVKLVWFERVVISSFIIWW